MIICERADRKKKCIYKKMYNLEFSLVSIKTAGASEDCQFNVLSAVLQFILLLHEEDWKQKGPCQQEAQEEITYRNNSVALVSGEGLSCNI